MTGIWQGCFRNIRDNRATSPICVEIEESGFLPTKICGKLLQSALATHFIHDSQPEPALPYDDRVLFVQVLDGSKCLKQGTRKDLQGELIERQIRSMLPLKGSGVTDYRLFFVRGVDDRAGLESVGVAVSRVSNREHGLHGNPLTRHRTGE